MFSFDDVIMNEAELSWTHDTKKVPRHHIKQQGPEIPDITRLSDTILLGN